MNTKPVSHIVRKSFPVVILRLVIMELLLETIYVGWRFGIDFSPIAPEMKILLHTFTTPIFIVVTFFQIFILISVLMKWRQEYYELQDDEIIQWTGLLSRKNTSYQYTNIQSIVVQQGLLGRLLGYGTVSLYIPALGQDLVFSEVPHPYAFAENIKSHMPASNQQVLLRRK